MLRFARRIGVLIASILVASGASAQTGTAGIAGTVKDPSGGVLPGVTVEASSPVLIEKTRSVVTDGTGQYNIVNLRPGVYTVTFTLAGFNTVKRDGIELTGSFVATVNADMKVGSLEETINVSGESPVVDIQSTRHEQTLGKDIIAALPSSRTYSAMVLLSPSISTNTTQDVGGAQSQILQPVLQAHGGRGQDGRILVDGMSVALPGGNRTMYQPNLGAAQEVTVSTSGGLGESETGGLIINLVPRDGGNTFKGNTFATFGNSAMQGSNFTQALKDQGLTAANSVNKVWDIQPNFGGPLRKDKLWFYVSWRNNGSNNNVAGMYYNQNAGNPNVWTYVPDLTRQAYDDRLYKSAALRLTWQATLRNKIALFADEQDREVWSAGGGTAVLAPETQSVNFAHPNRVWQVTYAAPVTNRLLIEAGASNFRHRYGQKPRDGIDTTLIPVTEQAGNIPGLQYRGLINASGSGTLNGWGNSFSLTGIWRASVSYVTGSHSAKFGYYGEYFQNLTGNYTPQSLAYRFSNGTPNQLTMSADPFYSQTYGHGTTFYAQDRWTVRRLTLQGGVRVQTFSNNWPDEQLGPVRFVTTPITVSKGDGANVKALTPRMGAAYDVFGNGKTAVRVSLAQYMASTGAAFGNLNPMARLTTSTTRSWNDNTFPVGDPRRGNFVPDCDLTNPLLNLECGANSAGAFGKATFTSTWDPAITTGWNTTPYEWDFDLGAQRELLPRVSVSVTYFRRWYGNFTVTDNLATSPSDYTLYKLPIPIDSRLPNGGGGFVTIPDIIPTKFGQTNNFVTAASSYGNQYEHWNGVDVDVSARPLNGLVVSGGTSTGRTFWDSCELQKNLPEAQSGIGTVLSNGAPTAGLSPLEYCNQTSNWLTAIKFLSTYTIPKADVQISGTLQNFNGPPVIALWTVPNATVVPALGRNLSGNAPNVTVNIVYPNQIFADRINEIDLRVAKILRIGRTRTQAAVDIFNLFNENSVQTFNNTYSPTGAWHVPTFILSPRFVKLSVNLEF